MKKGADENRQSRIYVSCMCSAQCVCGFMFGIMTCWNKYLSILPVVGLCMWHTRVKCVWETVVHLKCLSLMGMTLPSCVGKNVFVQFCAAEMNILSVIPIFPFFLAFFCCPISYFSLLFHTTSKGLFVSYVTNRSGSPQTWATSYKCHLGWLRHPGSCSKKASNLNRFIMHSK